MFRIYVGEVNPASTSDNPIITNASLYYESVCPLHIPRPGDAVAGRHADGRQWLATCRWVKFNYEYGTVEIWCS